MTDDFLYILADNSNNRVESRKLLNFANENNIPYFRLPNNPYSNIDPSRSHGLALNFIYKKIIKKVDCDYLGFIDQDIFPTESLSVIKDTLKLPYYGLIQTRENISYLWAGFCFFKKKFLINKIIDFMPKKGLDTAGRLHKFYEKQNLAKIDLEHYYIKIVNKEKFYTPYTGIQKECVEFIGKWIHMMNSSSWVADSKSKDIIEIINS